MRVTSNPVPITAEAEPFDPVNPEPFARLAGPDFIRIEDGTAIVRDQDGNEDVIRPGWLVIRPDRGGPAHYSNSANLGEGPGFFWNPA
jgi:hypothetical protein